MASNSTWNSTPSLSSGRHAVTAATIAIVGGVLWLLLTGRAPTAQIPSPVPVDRLESGTVARMDSAAIAYSNGWTVSALGADPGEPADPWAEPAGSLQFAYTGRELALQLAQGDYWGYLYVTVDGQPANRLQLLRNNSNSLGQAAGYKPLYAPELEQDGPTPLWIPVHAAQDDGPHTVSVEVWRSWGQTPLRGIAVDALPPAPPPRWPGAALLVLGLALLALPAAAGRRLGTARLKTLQAPAELSELYRALCRGPLLLIGAAALTVAAAGVGLNSWPVTLVGLAVLAGTALFRPALWPSALALALPFYYSFTLPILPGVRVSLIDVGVYGGAVIVAAALPLRAWQAPPEATGRPRRQQVSPAERLMLGTLLGLAGWALISATSARYPDVALDEWRLVFLAGAVFALTLFAVLATSRTPDADRALILRGWLTGAIIMAAVGIGQFAGGVMLIQAEGVQRIRGFYDSPNNLALYLERALPVLLATALFGQESRRRLAALGSALLVGGALLLTFSKGALLLALPVIFVVLWLGGFRLLRAEGRSVRPLWLLAVLGAGALVALLPFLGTERFANLLDLSQGTGYLRIQLWRSSWQMALDHAIFGVGPDNFLYAYRSDYLLPQAWQEPNLNHPHNWLLDWWTRLGLPGLALGLLFWAGGLTVIVARLRTATPRQRPLLLGLLAAVLASLAHGLIDLSYALPDLMLVWVLILGSYVVINGPNCATDRSPECARPE